MVTVPSGATTGPVEVTTPNGAADTTALDPAAFVVDATPRIERIHPPSGDVDTLVTIEGANFGAPAPPMPPLPPDRNVVTHDGVEWEVVRVGESRTYMQVRVAVSPSTSTTMGYSIFVPLIRGTLNTSS